MRLIRQIGLYAGVLALVSFTDCLADTPAATQGSAAGESCSGPARICGLDGPEDMVAVDGGTEVIASRLGGKGLNIIDTRTRAVSTIDPASLPEAPDPRYPCPDLKASGTFISHGLSLKPQADGHDRLLVVRHGGREAIEIFQMSHPEGFRSLAWIGCVPLPKGFAGNAVTGGHDGGFYVTSMTDVGDAPDSSKLAKLYAGHPSGSVLAWTPGAGFRSFPIGMMSGPNGIELSADERWLYVNGWASHEIVRFDLAHPDAPAKHLRVRFMPDNLRWAGDGSLIAAGVRSTPKYVYECAGTHADGSPCVTRWTAASIDPASMTLKSELSRDDRPGFGDVSVALPVGGALWLGAFDGDDIDVETPGSLLAPRHTM